MAELEALKLLRALDEGVAAQTGAAFFPHLVRSLAQTLDASYAFAAQFDTKTYQAHVLAAWYDGAFQDNYVYPLNGSPCECVLDNEIVAFPRRIQEMFPAEREALAQIGAQSYLAIPLSNESGKVCGHLAVIDKRERDWNDADRWILRIFSTRAAAELSRQDHERRLQEMNASLQKANAQLRREVTQRLQTEDQLATTTARSEQVAELVRVITSGVTSQTGEAFFQQLVKSLAEALNAATVFVSEIDTVAYEANMLAFWAKGALQTPERFNLSQTPCESILNGEIAAFPRRVAELFPAAREVLEFLGTRSYLAIPIIDGTAVIGHIAVQDQRERDWNEIDFGILRLFANRAAAELKRRAHEKSLEAANLQLQRANAALRREVATRLEMEGELAEAKQAAESAQCVAESASQAKSKFLAHMSHELRTPLNGILGYAQLLKRSASLTTDERAGIEVIEHSGEHLLTLINDLLDLAKIEAGRFDLHASGFELPLLLKQVADLIAVRATQAGLEFRCHLKPDLPLHVRADERAVRQILLNLLGNAVKFTQLGSIELRASTVSAGEGYSRIRFEVRDTGVGIAPEDRARIFEPFDRGAGGNSRVEGTGLGLAITRRLVDAMGGTIKVTGAPGEGSVFTVELDLEASMVESEASAAIAKAVGARGSPAAPAKTPVDGRIATELYDLAMKGDVKELLARAEAAIDGDPDGTPVYREVSRLARNFDMKGVRRALQHAQEVHG